MNGPQTHGQKSTGWRIARRRIRLTAILTFFTFAFVTATSTADAAALPVSTIKLSSITADFSGFVRTLLAESAPTPKQVSGTAVGHGGAAAQNKAGKGTGHAPGIGRGQVPSAGAVNTRPAAPGPSGHGYTGFNAKTSKRNAMKSTAYSDYFNNTDGSYTVKASSAPVNFKAADGSWQPTVTTLVAGSGGRLAPVASGIGVSFSGGPSVSPGAAQQSTSAISLVRTQSTVPADVASAPAQLAQVTLGSGESIGWSLSGAANVTPTVSGSTATYADLLPGTTLELATTDVGVKESLVLSSAAAGNSWTFPLTLTGVSLVDDPANGWELENSSGAPVAYLPTPYAYDATPIDPNGVGPANGVVTYALSTSESGTQSLVMTLDAGWLDDPHRDFPVTVDPTITAAADGESTYVVTNQNNNNSGSAVLKAGLSPTNSAWWAHGLVYLPPQAFPAGSGPGSGAEVTAAWVGLEDIWASTAAAEPIDVYPITQLWQASTTTSAPGPSIGPSMGEADVAAPRAATNNSLNPNVYNQILVPITNLSVINAWTDTDPSSYFGFEIGTPNENSLEWKQFDSANEQGLSPNITLTYNPDSPPQVSSTAPASGTSVSTLTPTLSATGLSANGWPLQCMFSVFNGTGSQSMPIVQSPLTSCAWAVPAGYLAWGQTYVWDALVYDGALASPVSAGSVLVTAIPPPLLTSSLSQNTSGAGFDPTIGNYTTAATDAQVSGAGPALSIVRNYNSMDPRTAGAFGAGWSSVLDARAAEQDDETGVVASVTVTYPDGSQVGYGENADGSFSPPLGRFATFVAVPGGGYSLTDKTNTVYIFGQSLGSGVWGISSITASSGPALDFTWSGGHITSVVSKASGRSLTIGWSNNRVATVTLPASGVSAPVWSYSYTGDELASVCSPVNASPACTQYTYQSGSEYQSAVLDSGPSEYWRLGEVSGSSTAADQVLANDMSQNGTYANVTLGASGPLTGSGSTSASFNGTSSTVSLSQDTPPLASSADQTVGVWFKTSSPGVILSVNSVALSASASPADYFPSLYVGQDGKLLGEWWDGADDPIESTNAVDDGKWHFAVLSGYGSGQTLYVDGKSVGSADNPITPLASSQIYDYLGAGYSSSVLPDAPQSSTASVPEYFNGSLADVASWSQPLSASQVVNLYQIGTAPTAQLTKITRPSGGVTAQIQYSAASGLVSHVTDQNGGVWTVGSPAVSGSGEVYRASVLSSAPSAYWRLGDQAGSAVAANQVAPDDTQATYSPSGVTLGNTDGPFGDATVAAFDGASGYVQAPASTVPINGSASVSMWFKTTTAPGILFSYQGASLSADNPYAGVQDVVYIGQDGQLYGGFSTSGQAITMASGAIVTDGAWHEATVTASGNSTETLYLDGQVVGTATPNLPISTDSSYVYIGAGTTGDGLYSLPNLVNLYYAGEISDVAFYPTQLSGTQVAAQYAAAKNSVGNNPLVSIPVTNPMNAVTTGEYDPDSGMRQVASIDPLGAKTTYGYDASGFLGTTVNPDGDETIAGHDPRGNTVSETTCQNQTLQECSTSYSSYYLEVSTAAGLVDTTTAALDDGSNTTVTIGSGSSAVTGTVVADPRNDMQVTSSDGRSASASDPTYQSTSSYNPYGDLVSQTTPPVPGYPQGRTSATTYTDGTTAFPAMSLMSSPGVPVTASPAVAVPVGLPWTQTDASGAVTQLFYYADGDLALKIDPDDAQETSYTYDALGRVLTQTLTYETLSNCTLAQSTSVCPTLPLTTTNTYNALNQVLTTTDPPVTDAVSGAQHQSKTSVVYNADNQSTAATVSDLTGGDSPRTTLTSYNQYGQVAYTLDAQQYIDGNGASGSPNLADATQYTYNAAGEKITATSPANQSGASLTTDYAYDADGRSTTTTLVGYTGSPAGSQSAANLVQQAQSYDPAGRLMSSVDAMGVATLYQYYDNGLTETVTQCSALAAGSNTACAGSSFVQNSDSYDGAGNLTAQVSNNGTTTTDYLFDAAGRQYETVLDPTGVDRVTTKAFNAADGVSSQTIAGGGQSATTAYAYDADGTMTAKSVQGTVANPFATASSPANQWKLNDGSGTTAANTVVPASTATVSSSGATWTADSSRAQVLALNGSSGSVTLPSSVVTLGSASVVLEMWFKTSTAGGVLFSHSASALSAGSTTGNYQPDVYVGSDGKLVAGVGAQSDVESAKAVDDGAWHQLVFVGVGPVYAQGTATLYLDGALVGSGVANPDGTAESNVYLGAGFIGGNWPDEAHSGSSTATPEYFNGDISNVQTYPSALTAAQVAALYSNSTTTSQTTKWTLDGRNLPLSMTDAMGNTTSYVFDAAGSQVEQVDPVVTAGTYSTATGSYTSALSSPISMVGYNTFGEKAETRDPDGNETKTVYDADGRAAGQIQSSYTQPGSVNKSTFAAAESTTAYNELGEPIASYDPTGDKTTFAYDQLGHQTTVTNPAGGVSTTAYDPDGQVVSKTDPAGNTQSSTWDYLGRQLTGTTILTGSSPVVGSGCTENNTNTQAACTDTFAYTDAAGLLSSQTSAGGVSESYGYDAVGEQISSTDGAGQTSTTGYDFAGRAVKQTSPNGTFSTVTYDSAGNQIGTAAYASGGTTPLAASSSVFDADGDAVAQTDALGYTSNHTYDATGALQSESQPVSPTSSITVSYGYDAAGHQTEYTPGNANAGTNGLTAASGSTYSTYNAWGLPESTVIPSTSSYSTSASRTSTVVYDEDGDQVEQDAPGGVVLQAVYNNLGEVTAQSGTGATAATASRSFTYTPDGQVQSSATSAVGTAGSSGYQAATSESFGYNNAGDLTGVTGSAGSSSFGYTADGQMASRTDASGTTGYTYDNDGRISSLTLPTSAGGTTLSYAYTKNSPNYSITYGTGGDVQSYSYNSLHQLTGDTLAKSTGTQIASISYGYNLDGLETGKTTTGLAGASANTYTYDEAGRLTSWANSAGTTSYTYDQDSNRTSIQSTMSGVASNVFTYDARDELTSGSVTGGAVSTYAYSANGDLSSQTAGTSGGNVTTYFTDDAYGQQSTAGSGTYAYDAAGRLLTQTTGTTGPITKTLAYSGTGDTVASDGTNQYAQDPGGSLVATGNPTAGTSSLLWTDLHTDVVGQFTPTGTTLTGSQAYDPLGNILTTAGTAGSLTVGYQSEWTDASTGHVNMGARWYSPSTGQFTNRDTASNSATPDPANANPFAYANANPLTGTDPSGHVAYFSNGAGVLQNASPERIFKTENYAVLVNAALNAHKDGQVTQDNVATIQQIVSNEWSIQTLENEPDDTPAVGGGRFIVGGGSVGSSRTDALASLEGQDASLLDQLGTQISQEDTASSEASQPCGWDSLGGCVHDAARVIVNNPIISMVVNTVVAIGAFAACSAGAVAVGVATGGAGLALEAGCGAVAGTASGLVNQGLKCAAGVPEACSGGAFLLAGTVGAVAGAVTAGTASGVGGAIGDAFGSSVAGSIAGAATTGAISGGVGGFASGVTSYAFSCGDSSSGCSFGGALSAGGSDAVTGAEMGGAVGGALGAWNGLTGEGDASSGGCGGANSFAGSTPVVMANGATTPISRVKVGDLVEASVPGQSGVSVHTVQNVIVTYTDHDLVDVTVAPTASALLPDAAASSTSASPSVKTVLAKGGLVKRAVLALAVGVGALAAGVGTAHSATPAVTTARAVSGAPTTGGVIHTTFLHPFYDETQASFVEAQNLRIGDLLQTPTGTAEVTDLHLFHANTTTYDLTISGLHTFYVVAGSTPVLVHNINGCGPGQDMGALARSAASDAPKDATMTAVARFKGTDLTEAGYSGPSSEPDFFEPEIQDALGDGGQTYAGDAANCAEIRACNLLIQNQGAEFESQVGRPLEIGDIEFLTVRSATGAPEAACLSCQSVLVRRGATDLSQGLG